MYTLMTERRAQITDQSQYETDFIDALTSNIAWAGACKGLQVNGAPFVVGHLHSSFEDEEMAIPSFLPISGCGGDLGGNPRRWG